MSQQMNQPTLYQLTSDTVQITYTTSDISGQPSLSYQGPFGSQPSYAFNGAAIHTEDSELGTLVSVTILPSVDAGATVMTLLIPNVHLQGEQSVPFETLSIVTQTFGILPHQGAQPTYQVVNLQGTARLAYFL